MIGSTVKAHKRVKNAGISTQLFCYIFGLSERYTFYGMLHIALVLFVFPKQATNKRRRLSMN
jgi:hypothetical protein